MKFYFQPNISYSKMNLFPYSLYTSPSKTRDRFSHLHLSVSCVMSDNPGVRKVCLNSNKLTEAKVRHPSQLTKPTAWSVVNAWALHT